MLPIVIYITYIKRIITDVTKRVTARMVKMKIFAHKLSYQMDTTGIKKSRFFIERYIHFKVNP